MSAIHLDVTSSNITLIPPITIHLWGILQRRIDFYLGIKYNFVMKGTVPDKCT